jgi:hypothetical protein
VYFDGHEREDVVQYRELWAKRMLEYQKKMKEFEGANMECVLEPNLRIWDKEHVLVTHDECIFYSNDAQASMWLEDGESVIRKKGQGGSVMVSEFLCACHGRLQIPHEDAIKQNIPASARVIIKPGKNADGFWKSDDMVEQLHNRALPIFEALHPGCTGSFQN